MFHRFAEAKTRIDTDPLAFNSRCHHRVDPVAQTERKRNLEHDYRQEQHVADRDQQACPQLVDAAPSGGARRKPTPRTVCR